MAENSRTVYTSILPHLRLLSAGDCSFPSLTLGEDKASLSLLNSTLYSGTSVGKVPVTRGGFCCEPGARRKEEGRSLEVQGWITAAFCLTPSVPSVPNGGLPLCPEDSVETKLDASNSLVLMTVPFTASPDLPWPASWLPLLSGGSFLPYKELVLVGSGVILRGSEMAFAVSDWTVVLVDGPLRSGGGTSLSARRIIEWGCETNMQTCPDNTSMCVYWCVYVCAHPYKACSQVIWM